MTEPNEDGLDFSYEPYVSQVPEALRTQIEPAFKEYNKHVTENVERFKPFNEILDQGWTPEHVTAGLGLLQELNTNPQRVFQALAEQNPELLQQFAPPQQQQITPTGPPAYTNPGNAPSGDEFAGLPPELATRLEQQEQLIQLLYQGFTQQQQTTAAQQEAAREQAELNQFKAELDQVAPESKYPRQFILSYISQGQSPTEAVKSFEQWRAQELSAQRAAGAPLIAPAGGGGLPSEPIDTSKLTDQQRKDLMVSYMEAANRQQ